MAARRSLQIVHPWLDLIGADPDDIRDFIAEIGAPYPARLVERVVLTGRKTGVSIEIGRSHLGGHVVESITAELVPAPKRPPALPADLVAGESRAEVHARLGPPSRVAHDRDEWILEADRTLSVRFERDRVVAVAVRTWD